MILEEVIKIFPYTYPCTASKFREQEEWIRQTLGEWEVDWAYARTEFRFKTEQDRTLFMLRWLYA